MQRSHVVLITDSREKVPLVFPDYLVVLRDADTPTRGQTTTVRITTRRATLPVGDYALEGHEDLALVERKAHMKEIMENCLSPDRPRFVACLERLASSCAYPLLLLEGDPFYLLSPDAHFKDPYLGWDALTRLLARYRIPYAVVSTNTLQRRRVVGEMVARHLIACTTRGASLRGEGGCQPDPTVVPSPES